MRRRAFLSALAAGPLLLRSRLSASRAPVRVAVVIGVDKTGSLPVLNAAVSGANLVGNWLETEGFEVRRFVTPPVTVLPIFETIADFVKRGTLDQLVVYFSGHGFIRDRSEMWLLSKAPENPNEAVSLLECVELARETAIPSVVIISDACRSATNSLNAQRVQGGVIFPNMRVSRNVRPEVDRFFAALPGDPALELAVDAASKTFEGIYTSSFLDAFKNPQVDMISTVDGVEVVPNRRLKRYLVDDVSRRAQARSVQLQQMPDAILECSDSTYIGQAVRSAPTLPDPPPPPPPPRATVGDVSSKDLSLAGLQMLKLPDRSFSDADLNGVAQASRFRTTQQAILDSTAPVSFETQTGLAVTGVRITRVLSSLGMAAELLESGDGAQRAALIRLKPAGRQPASSNVLLQFADGGGTLIAALQGYIGAVTVQGGLVTNVNYTPSRNDPRWNQADYENVRALRAAVAAAAKFGTFRIEGSGAERSQKGAALANRIRAYKAIDPSLGLYAAYAYAEAGLRDQIQSVRSIMQSDLGVDMFDLAMLAGALSENPSTRAPTVPFCPLLSQGWSWLRVRNARVSPNAARVREYLRPALWTTFDSGAIPAIESEFT